MSGKPVVYNHPQGDVNFFPSISTMTAEEREKNRIYINGSTEEKTVVALGEVTGHHHRFERYGLTGVRMFRDDAVARTFPNVEGKSLYIGTIEVPEDEAGVAVVHEEHRPLELPPGLYDVVGQRQYDPLANRRVVD